MSTTEFLPFACDSGARVMAQSDYNAASARTGGNPPGLASGRLNNKALRQSSLLASAVTQTMADLLGVNIIDDGDPSALAAQFKAMLYAVTPYGVIVPYVGKVAPVGFWIPVAGTIGDASSNGTARANADCFGLFSHYWTEFTDGEYPIYTSAGAGSTRGASAAVDWAAHKAITGIDPRGNFLRFADAGSGVDPGRTVGDFQDFAVQEFKVEVPLTNGGGGAVGAANFNDRGSFNSYLTGVNVTDLFGGSTIKMADETRPRNNNFLGIMRL